MTQAIIYTRFSPRPNADECKSNEKQAERCIEYCVRKGYCYHHPYSDEAKSGSVLQRPGLGAALNALRPGMVLVVDSSDRLARDMLVYLTICHEVKEAGATIEYANGTPTATTPEGTLIGTVLAAFSAYDRDRICLRTKNGLARKRKNGERTTGKIPIGWKLDPENEKRLVVCKKERQVILEVCCWAELGWSSEKMVRYFNNCSTLWLCRGKPWSPRTIRRLIKRHSYWAAPSGDSSLEPTHS